MRRIALFVLPLTACGAPMPHEVGSELAALRHEVDVIVDRGVVGMTVERTLVNGPDEEIRLTIPLPTGGAVDAFAVAIDGEWYEGNLLDSDAASERYLALAGFDDGRFTTETFRPPFLLSWVDAGTLELEAHPVPPGATIELRYHVTAPTCSVDGTPVFDYPNDDVRPELFGAGLVRDVRPDEDFGDACEGHTLATSEDRLIVELEPLETGRIDARWSETWVGPQRVARFVLDLPAQLAEIPERPSVVFVVDGSVSQHDENLATQLSWAQAYLMWVPDAMVQVVVFHRFAETLFDGYLPAAQFADAIAGLQYEAQNGSNLDEGLTLTRQVIQTAPTSEVRVVATSDLLLKTGFDEDAAEEILATTNATAHMLRLSLDDEAAPGIEPSSFGLVHGVAAATGGLYGDLEGSPTDEDAIAVVEELVRPIALRIDTPDPGVDVEIQRGETSRQWTYPDADLTVPNVLSGRVWNREIEIELTRASDAAMPALLVGSTEWYHFDEAHLRDLAMSGGVVSPLTSYLAEDGGAPALEGFGTLSGLGGFGVAGFGTSCGCGGIMGLRGVGMARPTEWLLDTVRDAAEACGADGVHVTIETTLDEIVDVGGANDCVLERLWQTRLPGWFSNEPARIYEVAL